MEKQRPRVETHLGQNATGITPDLWVFIISPKLWTQARPSLLTHILLCLFKYEIRCTALCFYWLIDLCVILLGNIKMLQNLHNQNYI
jgi:hypothetical protein